MDLGQTAWVLTGLAGAGWTLAAGWAVVAALRARAEARDAQARAFAAERRLGEAPAQLLTIRADDRLEGNGRLAGWLGFSELPSTLAGLDDQATGRGFTTPDLARLTAMVASARSSARAFRMTLSARDSRRSLTLRGGLAGPQAPGCVHVWVFDSSESEGQLVHLKQQAAEARGEFAALSGLIEAAPMAMWFRNGEGTLQLVNSAYVAAVGAGSADEVIARGSELVERIDGLSPRDVALQAAQRGSPVERLITATIAGQRRSLRVTDLPLGAEGIAGYALDVEDMEEQARALRAFREAQRSMLDLLSAGVAQFDARRRLVFANQPFQRTFALSPAELADPPLFARWLDMARDAGRVPEMRDYPAWRREREGWFIQNIAQEEAWPLSDGTHVRLVAQPMPDGGLLLIAEDRTETLRISAMRDTLLRTRTAMFDSLFEAVAVFAPDGRLQLWNRRFAAAWGLEGALLDSHPRIAELLPQIAPQLARAGAERKVGDVVRAATLERRQTSARVALGDGRILEISGVPLPDGNGLLTVLDITDSQKAEEALRERNAALVEADRLKTRFLATMSYEFRTPLTNIGGFAELMEAGLGGDLNESGRDYVAAILGETRKLGEQIENVLDLSQSEAGLLPLARETIDLVPFVTRLVEQRGPRLRESGLTLDLRCGHDVGTITGDPRRLERAIGHLVDNAINATPGGGRLLVEVTRQTVADGSLARIVVSDNGPGMDAQTLARALGGLEVSPERAAAPGGLAPRQGLGLPLARQLIEAHGGRLDLYSEPGQGTAAIVELP